MDDLERAGAYLRAAFQAAGVTFAEADLARLVGEFHEFAADGRHLTGAAPVASEPLVIYVPKA